MTANPSSLQARLEAMLRSAPITQASREKGVNYAVALDLLRQLDELGRALAESEAKVKELKAKLAECCYVIRSMTSRAVLDGFESPDELEAWMKQIFNTGYKWLQENRDLVKQDDETRKKGAEHGE